MTDGRMPRRRFDKRATGSGSFGGIISGASTRSLSTARAAEGAPTADVMRQGRRRWATGVAILTTVEQTGDTAELRGGTMSSFTVVSLAPPLVLVCLERGSRLARLVPAAGAFAISLLDRAHEFEADRFAGMGPLPDSRFTGIPYELGETGCPVLVGALAWFDCQVGETIETGDHLTVIGEVVAAGLGLDSDDPLLNYEGAFRRIESA